MENDRRRGGNWAKHNFFAIVGLAVVIAGYIWWASRWSTTIDMKLNNMVTREEFIHLQDQLNDDSKKLDKLDCRIYDGCGSHQPVPLPTYDSKTGVVNHP